MSVKKYMFLFIVLIYGSINAQHNKIEWSLDYDLVLKKANKNKKPILIYFSGSDWCGPCVKLKKNYNLLYVDIPQNQDIMSKNQYKKNKKLLYALNPRKVFPTVLILNKRGREKERISGYSSISNSDNYLKVLRENR